MAENVERAAAKRGTDLSAEIAKHRAHAAAAERRLAEVFAWEPDQLSFGRLRWSEPHERP